MRINSSKNVSSAGGAKKTQKKGSGKTFSPIEDETVASGQSVAHTVAITDVDSILALQSVDAVDVNGARKKAVIHADEMLSELEKLKLAILSGGQPHSHLLKLKDLLEQKPEYTEDSGLVDILDQINLRVSVELAKFNARNR